MKFEYAKYSGIIAAACALTVPAMVKAATSFTQVRRLDAQLAVIARAAAEKRVEPLMSAALNQELFLRNSPLVARWNAAGEVQVYLHFNEYGNPPATADLRQLGATDIVVCPELSVVQAWIPASELANAAALANVTRVTVPRYAVTKRAPQTGALTRTGSVDTQGDAILGAQAFRQATGWSGQGITVGVISDGDTSIASSQKTGDLPANIWNDPNDAGSFKSSGDEGTAMMEIVYDLAPGVKQLGFCGPQTDVDFVTCLNDFASNINANIIVDDLGFPGEAMFADGKFATAVKNFAIAHPNIQLVSAAGNDATGFWSGTWQPTTASPTSVNGVNYSQMETFTGKNQITFDVNSGDTVSYVVEWDDPWDDTDNNGQTDPNDYDVVLFDSQGNAVACNQGENISTGSLCNQTNSAPLNSPGPTPIQGDQWTNNGSGSAQLSLKIFKGAGTPGSNIRVLVASQKSNLVVLNPTKPANSIFGQSALAFPYEITVGAVPQSNTGQIEVYSSQGPVNIEFPTASVRTPKPDIVGVDCVNTTGAGGFPEPFCGTSAAAPHIAGLLALLESAYAGSGKTPFQLLRDGASDGSSPGNVFGYGLPDLMNTLSTDPVPLATSFTLPSGTITPGMAVTFTGNCLANGSSTGVSYSWNFGSAANPATSTAQDPSVTFNTTGTFSVSLQCSNNHGLSNSVSQSLVVSASSGGSGGGGSGGGGLGILALAALLFVEIAALRQRKYR